MSGQDNFDAFFNDILQAPIIPPPPIQHNPFCPPVKNVSSKHPHVSGSNAQFAHSPSSSRANATNLKPLSLADQLALKRNILAPSQSPPSGLTSSTQPASMPVSKPLSSDQGISASAATSSSDTVIVTPFGIPKLHQNRPLGAQSPVIAGNIARSPGGLPTQQLPPMFGLASASTPLSQVSILQPTPGAPRVTDNPFRVRRPPPTQSPSQPAGTLSATLRLNPGPAQEESAFARQVRERSKAQVAQVAQVASSAASDVCAFAGPLLGELARAARADACALPVGAPSTSSILLAAPSAPSRSAFAAPEHTDDTDYPRSPSRSASMPDAAASMAAPVAVDASNGSTAAPLSAACAYASAYAPSRLRDTLGYIQRRDCRLMTLLPRVPLVEEAVPVCTIAPQGAAARLRSLLVHNKVRHRSMQHGLSVAIGSQTDVVSARSVGVQWADGCADVHVETQRGVRNSAVSHSVRGASAGSAGAQSVVPVDPVRLASFVRRAGGVMDALLTEQEAHAVPAADQAALTGEAPQEPLPPAWLPLPHPGRTDVPTLGVIARVQLSLQLSPALAARRQPVAAAAGQLAGAPVLVIAFSRPACAQPHVATPLESASVLAVFQLTTVHRPLLLLATTHSVTSVCAWSDQARLCVAAGTAEGVLCLWHNDAVAQRVRAPCPAALPGSAASSSAASCFPPTPATADDWLDVRWPLAQAVGHVMRVRSVLYNCSPVAGNTAAHVIVSVCEAARVCRWAVAGESLVRTAAHQPLRAHAAAAETSLGMDASVDLPSAAAGTGTCVAAHLGGAVYLACAARGVWRGEPPASALASEDPLQGPRPAAAEGTTLGARERAAAGSLWLSVSDAGTAAQCAVVPILPLSADSFAATLPTLRAYGRVATCVATQTGGGGMCIVGCDDGSVLVFTGMGSTAPNAAAPFLSSARFVFPFICDAPVCAVYAVPARPAAFCAVDIRNRLYYFDLVAAPDRPVLRVDLTVDATRIYARTQAPTRLTQNIQVLSIIIVGQHTWICVAHDDHVAAFMLRDKFSSERPGEVHAMAKSLGLDLNAI